MVSEIILEEAESLSTRAVVACGRQDVLFFELISSFKILSDISVHFWFFLRELGEDLEHFWVAQLIAVRYFDCWLLAHGRLCLVNICILTGQYGLPELGYFASRVQFLLRFLVSIS